MTLNKSEAIKAEFQQLVKKRHDGYIISLEALYEWLEEADFYKNYIDVKAFRDKYNAKYFNSKKNILNRSEDENDVKHDIFIRKTDGVNIPWFSVRGFKKFCMFLDTQKSILVRDYFIEIEDSYFRVLEQTQEENAKEREENAKRIRKFESDVAINKLKLSKSSKENEKLLEQNVTLASESETTKNIAPILERKEDFEEFGDKDYKELMALRNKYMKKVPVYIVNPDFIAKKPKPSAKPTKKKKVIGILSESENAEEEVNPESTSTKASAALPDPACNDDARYTKKFNRYTFADINISYEPPSLYYHISTINSKANKSPEDYHKICDLYVKDASHLKMIKEVLDSDETGAFGTYKFKTAKKDIYMMKYAELKDIRAKYIQDKLCDKLKKEHDELTIAKRNEFRELIIDSDNKIL
jgi:hypothetical protein